MLSGGRDPRPEGGPDAEEEVAARIPRFEVLEDVREVHHRPMPEVAAGPLVGHAAEALEVRNPRRSERAALGRRKAEEELSVVGDRIGAGDPGRGREPFGKPGADETAANARRLEDALQPCEQPLPRRRDMRPNVARRSTTRSLLSRRVVSGSLGKRTASTSTGTRRPRRRDAMRSIGR